MTTSLATQEVSVERTRLGLENNARNSQGAKEISSHEKDRIQLTTIAKQPNRRQATKNQREQSKSLLAKHRFRVNLARVDLPTRAGFGPLPSSYSYH
jgi:hypothetical protein